MRTAGQITDETDEEKKARGRAESAASVAQALSLTAGFIFTLWFGAQLGHMLPVSAGVLIWYALATALIALGFALYYWGATSGSGRATERGTKDE